MLFHTREDSFNYPPGALGIAVDVYSSVHGGPVVDPDRFETDLRAYGAELRQLAAGTAISNRQAGKEIAAFLKALLDRARGQLQVNANHPH